MDVREVEPWIKCKINALTSYRVGGTLFTIPFTTASDLTFKKSREKYILECRRLPNMYSAVFDEKCTTSLRLEPPIALNRKLKIYFPECSSQHMATIIESLEETYMGFGKVDFLVASETLNKIAGSVFNQERSWKLRAYVEKVNRNKTIILCDDDLDEKDAGLPPALDFLKERNESMSYAQELCERHSESNTNFHLHGGLAVLSSFTVGPSKVSAVVFGEVDMVSGQKPINTHVFTGLGRSNRMSFGTNGEVINRCFEYLWSRSFWLGLENCLVGLRKADEEPIEFAQKLSLRGFYRQHRHRNERLADVATYCVGRVLHELREAVLTDERVNWIVEYKGSAVDPDNIKISKASESYSFILIRQKHHMKRLNFMDLATKITNEKLGDFKRKNEGRRSPERKRVRVYPTKKHDFLDLPLQSSDQMQGDKSIGEKIRNYLKLKKT